jgi:hypothetical protein
LVRTVEVIRSESGDTPEYPLVDLTQALAELTVAPPDDQSSWFDLATALTSG